MSVEAVRVAVRLRRFWLEKVVGSPEFLASDLAGEHDIRLRRVSNELIVSGGLEFGEGDPFSGDLGDLVRRHLSPLSDGAVTQLGWRREFSSALIRRARTTDLDILDPGDPPANSYAVVAGHLRRAFPGDLPEPAREALSCLRVAAVSRHRLWIAAESATDAQAIGTIPGARAALVTAVQRYQGHEVPLYRMVVDPELGRIGPGL